MSHKRRKPAKKIKIYCSIFRKNNTTGARGRKAKPRVVEVQV